MRYTLRLDKISDTDELTLSKYLEKYMKYLVYFEISQKTKKPHWQGVIEFNDEKEYKAAKVRFTSMFPEHKGSKKSMTSVKKETYEIYISKDGDMFKCAGWTQQEIEQLQSQSYRKDDAVKDARNSFQKAFDFCVNNGITVTSDGYDIVVQLIKYYCQEVKCEPNDFQLKNMAKSIHAQLVYQQGDKQLFDAYAMRRAQDIIGCTWIH